MELKLSYNFSGKQVNQLFSRSLNHLRSLTLDSMEILTIDQIIAQDVWNHLGSLYVWFGRFGYNDKVCETSIWILKTCVSKLKSLKYLSIREHEDAGDCAELVTSRQLLSEIRSTAFPYHCVSLTTICIHGLENFLSRLPNVQTLSLVARLKTSGFSYPTMVSLHQCKLKLIEPSFESIKSFLSSCPNLQRLSLTMVWASFCTLDNNKWQSVTERYLPQLDRFKIDMWAVLDDITAVERSCTADFENNPFWRNRNTRIIVLSRHSYFQSKRRRHIIIQFDNRRRQNNVLLPT